MWKDLLTRHQCSFAPRPFFTFALLLAALTLSSPLSWGDITNPYDILERHYEALGGLDRLKGERRSYTVAELSTSGLTGTIEIRTDKPFFERQDIDLVVVTQSSGDNGEISWTADANGHVTIDKNEATVGRRRVKELLAQFEELNRESSQITLSYDGVEEVSGIDCLVVTLANSINSDTTRQLINAENFLLECSVQITPDRRTKTFYSDYREVKGVLHPFGIDTESSPSGQTVSMRVQSMEINGVIDTTLFSPPNRDARDFRFTSGNASEKIPFLYLMDHIFLPVNVGGKERYWILDSGAGISIIDSTFAASLDLKMEGDLKGLGAGGQVSIRFVSLPAYSVEGIEFKSQKIGAIDLQSIVGPMGIDAVGILGFDFLARFTMKVDFAGSTVSFYNPEHFEYSGDGLMVEAPLLNNDITVEMSVDDQFSGRWRIDLGAGKSSFHYPFAAANGLLERSGIDRRAYGAGGGSPTRAVQFKNAELAGFRIQKPLVSVRTERAGGALEMTELIGNLGNNILRHFTLYFDYHNQKLIIEKGADFGRDFPMDKSGLGLIYDDESNLTVDYVAPKTPAHQAGFQPGDIVHGINGIALKYLDGSLAIRNMLMESEGTQYLFSVERDGKKRELQLTLGNLF